MGELQAENRFTDCLCMKLHSTPVQSEGATFLELPHSSGVAIKGQVVLKLTLRFSKQEIKTPGGQVWFGLRRGELRLKLKNGKIPLEKMGLANLFEVEIEVEEQLEKGQESEGTLAVSPNMKLKSASKTITKAKHKVRQVSNRGSEKEPVWEFEVKAGTDPYLNGVLQEECLGTVEVNGATCIIEATFVVRGQGDIHLLDSTGLFAAKNLSRNKTALLTREFFLRFIAPKLQPYLSQVKGEL